MEGLVNRLPAVNGTYRLNAPLDKNSWFQVGGPAEVLFKPADAEDLAHFFKACPEDIPKTILGVASNVIIRDGGVDGVVIRLGRGFTDIEIHEDAPKMTVGAGVLDAHVAQAAMRSEIAGLEFLSGIPGTIGGAVAMNAGAYGTEIRDVLESATIVTAKGEIVTLSNDELGFSYRRSKLPLGAVVVEAAFRTGQGDPNEILTKMAEIKTSRESTQPVRSRTGGSTFKNPPSDICCQKAWQLIDEAGGRGLTLGGAQVSEKHCNFLINTGQATAADLEGLGEILRQRVKDKFGINLQWEIKRLGKQGVI